MPPQPTKHIRTYSSSDVRIGPISLITLIIVICLAVMGVLAASTAHATNTISNKQAEATRCLYHNERAGQEFVAGVDDALASVRSSGGTASAGAQAVTNALDSICAQARSAADGLVSCVADVEGTTVTAEFVCQDTRRLRIALTIRDGATYRIEQWEMTSAQQQQSTDTLWTGAN